MYPLDWEKTLIFILAIFFLGASYFLALFL